MATINGTNGNDTLNGGDQNDVINGLRGQDVLKGNGGNDTLNGGADFNFLDGGTGNDVLNGGDDGSTFTGGAGNDTLNGGAGTDFLFESGNVNFVLTNTKLTGNGTDILSSIERASLFGGDGNNKLDATSFSGDVSFFGGNGNDTLLGGSNNDDFDGGAGNDLINGGAGNSDRVNAFSEKGNIVLTDSKLTGSAATGLGTDTLVSIESARLQGGNSNNKLDASFFSGGGDLIGNGGNDTLLGGSGDDRLIGGTGNDILKGGFGIDDVQESGNVNFVLTDTSLTGLGKDTLQSIELADLTGGSSDNVLDASAFSGSFGAELSGGDGNDILLGSISNDLRLNGDNGDDVVSGGEGNDFLLGGNGSDMLRGGFDNDQLLGEAGNDTLFGAISARESIDSIDTLTGGQGSDLFVLSNAKSVFYNDGIDQGTDIDDFALITDFTKSQDTIQLKAGVQFILGSSPISGISGTGIFQVGSDGFSTDLIAVVQNVSGLDLNSNDFSFVF